MSHTFSITDENTGERLDVFLASHLPDLTRSAIAKRLKAGSGRVNGKPATVHHFIKAGDIVEFDPEGRGERAATSSKRPEPQHAFPATPLKIINETDDWLVIDKPAGLLVHPDASHAAGTLVDLLVAHDPKIAKIGEDPTRPGIMHRLDREVSGLMVIAKTQRAFDDLKRQFAEHSVEKKYLALVHGVIAKDEGDIKFRIARSKTKARMAARPEHEEVGQAAWTHYKVITRFTGATLIELTILSGRTHQIRAHLLALDHAIMGDPLYVARRKSRTTVAPRLLLQAIHLSFNDPASGERKSFDLAPVKAFEEVLKTFKSHAPKPKNESPA